MCEIRTALNDLGKADDPFERSGALEALAATLRREAPASVVMGAGTAELVATAARARSPRRSPTRPWTRPTLAWSGSSPSRGRIG